VLFLQVIYFSHAVEEERERARLDKKQELRWLHQAEELANRRKSMHAVRMYSRKKERNKKTASSWLKERVMKGKELWKEPVGSKERVANHRVH